MTIQATYTDNPEVAGQTKNSQVGAAAHVKPLESSQLFADKAEVLIRHGDEIYRLRLTRQNRLILTK
jgi:hemin uptake protein HemP